VYGAQPIDTLRTPAKMAVAFCTPALFMELALKKIVLIAFDQFTDIARGTLQPLADAFRRSIWWDGWLNPCSISTSAVRRCSLFC
jgi:hypothetical protein